MENDKTLLNFKMNYLNNILKNYFLISVDYKDSPQPRVLCQRPERLRDLRSILVVSILVSVISGFWSHFSSSRAIKGMQLSIQTLDLDQSYWIPLISRKIWHILWKKFKSISVKYSLNITKNATRIFSHNKLEILFFSFYHLRFQIQS